jgi:DNA-binding response OmpR family regulator
MKVLLVEDDAMLGESTRVALEGAHYVVEWVDSLGAARARLDAEGYALALLDLGLPDASGWRVVAALRETQAHLPVVVISANDDIGERIRALDAGADDFMVKPFDFAELMARARAAMRRRAGEARSRLRAGAVELDLAACQVFVDRKHVALRRREYQVLVALLMRRGRVVSRANLEEAVTTWDRGMESNAIEVAIHHLRRKLGDGIIETVRGIGYVIRNGDAGAVES